MNREYILKNTEKFCVVKINRRKLLRGMKDRYYNRIFDFTGTMSECIDFASLKRFGGGVEVLESKKRRTNEN